MESEYREGICMMCLKAQIAVRHINLYIIGSEGFWCCRECENKVVEFTREESRKAVYEKAKKKKEEILLKRREDNEE